MLIVNNVPGAPMKKDKDGEFSIYDECKTLLDDIAFTTDNKKSTCITLFSKEKPLFSNSTVPAIIQANNPLYAQNWGSSFFYISDIHLTHRILQEYPNGADNEQIRIFVKKLILKMLTHEFRKEPKFLFGPKYLLIGGDVSESFRLSEIFYQELRTQLVKLELKHIVIFVVLGNHELWDFESIEDCKKAYEELLTPLNMNLLCNTYLYLNFKPSELAQQNKKHASNYDVENAVSNDDSKIKLLVLDRIILVGGTGFAGCNDEFNANNGIYRTVLNREQEIIESSRFKKLYQEALEKAKEYDAKIVVFTHNPIQDWMGKDFKGDPNCVYFNGHTHKNNILRDDSNNIHVFADNQIGYLKKTVRLKLAKLYTPQNPFAGLGDGYYEVNSNDYIRFYHYLAENLEGNKIAERMIKENNCKFYMIKRSGYYGFFLLSPQKAYILAGGRVTCIGKNKDLNYYYEKFESMIKAYIKLLKSYRLYQEQIANWIRSFGGSGKIHGCIVDIDFDNHVEISLLNGCVSFYNAPRFGTIQTYSSMEELLRLELPSLLKQYKKTTSNILENRKNIAPKLKEPLKVDTKNGEYGISRRVQQVQYLFSCHLLRVWNEKLLEPKDKKIKSLVYACCN